MKSLVLSLGLSTLFTPLALGQSEAQLETLSTVNGGSFELRGENVHWIGDQLYVTSRVEDGSSDERVLIYDLPVGTTVMPSPTTLAASNLPIAGRFGLTMSDEEGFLFASVERAGPGEVRVYQDQGGTWNEFQTLTPPVGDPDDRYGHATAVDGNLLVVGAPQADSLGSRLGSAYTYEFDGVSWNLTQELAPASPPQGAFTSLDFGRAVATDGASIFVGASKARVNEQGVFYDLAGEVYVFENGPGGWTETQVLRGQDVQRFARFGLRVVYESGRLFVGAPGQDDDEGAIYVFEKIAGSWQQTSEILPSLFPTSSNLQTTQRVGISFDVQGSQLVCGLPPNAVRNTVRAGKVFVLEQSSGTWNVTRLLRRSTPQFEGLLGLTVSIGSAGWIAAGSPGIFGDGFSEALLFDTENGHSMYCFGRGAANGACADCPCSNNAPDGSVGGCVHSEGRSAELQATGVASVANDTMQFSVRGALDGIFMLLLSGAAALPAMGSCQGGGVVNPVLDGLRCVGSNLLRHGLGATDFNGDSLTPWGPPVAPAAGGLVAGLGAIAGQTRFFQVFFREYPDQGCMTTIGTTNAVRVEIRP